MYDCQACGACCRNALENRREGVDQWVEVDDDEPLLRRRRLVTLWRRNAAGVVHLRLVDDGRCIALRGTIGVRTRCAVYEVRPRACRRVLPGDRDCELSRAQARL